jgi:esterase/lipase superfamily enzyme
VNREVADLWSDALGAAGTVIRYGHWGRPVLVFPSEQGRAADFENNGMIDAVAGLLEAGRLKIYCGQGQWEDTTGSLQSTKRFAALLAGKRIRHELDLWGHDVPHDWPSWRAQVAHHMPRFC